MLNGVASSSGGLVGAKTTQYVTVMIICALDAAVNNVHVTDRSIFVATEI